jgi:hypothetical protein
MPDWERWTLTHSLGAAVVLASPLLLVLGLGLVVTKEARVAAGVAVVVDASVDEEDAEGDAEAVFLGEALALAVADRVVDDRVGEALAAAE